MDVPTSLLNKRADHKALSARGGKNSGPTKRAWATWRRCLVSSRASLARWHPDDPALSVPFEKVKALYESAFHQGFAYGAGSGKPRQPRKSKWHFDPLGWNDTLPHRESYLQRPFLSHTTPLRTALATHTPYRGCGGWQAWQCANLPSLPFG